MTHDFKRFPELTNNQMTFYYFESPHRQITENFMAKVVKVTDGDTIRVTTDFRDFSFPIRFINTDAPEIIKGEEGAIESQKWLENLILNQEVEILIDPQNRVEKWGRLLGEVLFQGININKQSILENFAVRFEDRELINAAVASVTETR